MVGSWIFNFHVRVFCVSRIHILFSFAVRSRGGVPRAGIPTATLADVNGIRFSDSDFVIQQRKLLW